MTASRDLVVAAIRIAADVSNRKGAHPRTFVKRSHVEDLRTALDKAGYGNDWRTLHKVIRIEERQPPEAANQ